MQTEASQGPAPSRLAGSWTVDETFDVLTAAAEDTTGAVRFRRGFMIGDGTGVDKGRESASIILDNWLRGRRKAVCLSISDKLIEDAQRDWSVLGMERLLVTPLSRFPQGKPITLSEGILFLTYRIELTGLTDTMRQRLTGYGLFHEIISWKLRFFVPTDAKGAEVLARVLGHWRSGQERRGQHRERPSG